MKPRLTMSLWNEIADREFTDWSHVEVAQVPLKGDRIIDMPEMLPGGHVQHNWVVALVDWRMHPKGSHAKVHLVPAGITWNEIPK